MVSVGGVESTCVVVANEVGGVVREGGEAGVGEGLGARHVHEGGGGGDLELGAAVRDGEQWLDLAIEESEIPSGGAGLRSGVGERLQADVVGLESGERCTCKREGGNEGRVAPLGDLEGGGHHFVEVRADGGRDGG